MYIIPRARPSSAGGPRGLRGCAPRRRRRPARMQSPCPSPCRPCRPCLPPRVLHVFYANMCFMICCYLNKCFLNQSMFLTS